MVCLALMCALDFYILTLACTNVFDFYRIEHRDYPVHFAIYFVAACACCMRVVAIICSKISLWKLSANRANPGDTINWFLFFCSVFYSVLGMTKTPPSASFGLA
jgi:hypothetical protein